MSFLFNMEASVGWYCVSFRLRALTEIFAFIIADVGLGGGKFLLFVLVTHTFGTSILALGLAGRVVRVLRSRMVKGYRVLSGQTDHPMHRDSPNFGAVINPSKTCSLYCSFCCSRGIGSRLKGYVCKS